MRKLTKKYARTLSHKITNQQLCDMLERAMRKISDWTVPSRANKGMSRGAHWNMFCKGFDINDSYSHIIKYRLLEEYGEYLDSELKEKIPPKKIISRSIHHQEPDFTYFNNKLKNER